MILKLTINDMNEKPCKGLGVFNRSIASPCPGLFLRPAPLHPVCHVTRTPSPLSIPQCRPELANIVVGKAPLFGGIQRISRFGNNHGYWRTTTKNLIKGR